MAVPLEWTRYDGRRLQRGSLLIGRVPLIWDGVVVDGHWSCELHIFAEDDDGPHESERIPYLVQLARSQVIIGEPLRQDTDHSQLVRLGMFFSCVPCERSKLFVARLMARWQAKRGNPHVDLCRVWEHVNRSVSRQELRDRIDKQIDQSYVGGMPAAVRERLG